VRDLASNTARAGVSVEAAEVPSDAFLLEQGEAAEFVLADPPREGIGKPAVERLLQLKPETLVIVACDPATLARDLAGLRAGFEIAEITMVDLFPQTFHMETIVKLTRA